MLRLRPLVVLLALLGLGPGCGLFGEDEAPEEALAPCEVLIQLQRRAGAEIAGPPGRLNEYAIQSGGVQAFIPSGCTRAVAARLEESACDFCNRTPSQCEALVRGVFSAPPLECSPCGDGVCDGGESALQCPIDCAASCGDGQCEDTESRESCAIDCATPCGNGLCDGQETPELCPDDCNFSVGDGICSRGENSTNSPNDCGGQVLGQPCSDDAECRGKVCVNGACTCNVEEGGICAKTTCGDSYCQSYETSFNCPEDCCSPRVCDSVGGRGCQGDAVITCNPDGEGACPEVAVVELCEFGCSQGRCLTCPTSYEGVTFCERPGLRCDGETLVLCEPFPGLPQCFSESRVSCLEALTPGGEPLGEVLCTPDGCQLGCSEAPCAVGETRCTADGGAVEQCVDRANGSACVGWQLLAPCAAHEVCGENSQERPPLICLTIDAAVTTATPARARVGEVIALEGYGFGATQGLVLFTPELLAGVGLWSDTLIYTSIPAGAISGPIQLNTADGRTISGPRVEVLP